MAGTQGPKLIADYTLPSNATSYTFNSIPQTYTDLLLKVSARTLPGAGTVALQVYFNGSNSSLQNRYYFGNGSGVGTNNQQIGYAGETATDVQGTYNFSAHEIYIPNYSNSSYYKPFSGDGAEEAMSGTVYLEMNVNSWNSTAAITSLTLTNSGGPTNFSAGNRFSLYGIKNS